MKVSKISSKATYHKCMKELHNFGYLKYMPSYNPYKGSLVYLFNFETSTEQVTIPHHTKKETSTELAPIRYRTKIDTSTELAQEPYTNNTNILNKTDENQLFFFYGTFFFCFFKNYFFTQIFLCLLTQVFI